MRILYLIIVFILALPPFTLADETQQKVVGLNIGFLYNTPVDFTGWTYSHERIRKELEKMEGVKTSYVENVTNNLNAELVLKNMALLGKNIIFATSYSYSDPMVKMAKLFPDIHFFNCGGLKSGDNLTNYFGRMYQARYLSGIVAGAMTKSNKIGYVAAFPIAEVIRGINAFTLGIQTVNPQAKVHVIWTKSWYNPLLETTIAKSLIGMGCDILAQHQDTSAVQTVAEKNKIYSIGYHTDMSEVAPNAHLTAAVWKWDSIYKMILEKISDNTWKHGSYWYGLEVDAVDISPFNKIVPQDVRDLVAQAKKNIIAGKLTIFEGPIKDQEDKIRIPAGVKLTDKELLDMSWFVDGVIGNIE